VKASADRSIPPRRLPGQKKIAVLRWEDMPIQAQPRSQRLMDSTLPPLSDFSPQRDTFLCFFVQCSSVQVIFSFYGSCCADRAGGSNIEAQLNTMPCLPLLSAALISAHNDPPWPRFGRISETEEESTVLKYGAAARARAAP